MAMASAFVSLKRKLFQIIEYIHSSASEKKPSCNANPTMSSSPLDDCPKGYPALTAFISSEQSFSLYPRSSYLHPLMLLRLQEDVLNLERELEEEDQHTDRYSFISFRSCREGNLEPHGKDNARGRREILTDLRKKLVEYDECLHKVRAIQQQQQSKWAEIGSEESVFSGTWDVSPSNWESILLNSLRLVGLSFGRIG